MVAFALLVALSYLCPLIDSSPLMCLEHFTCNIGEEKKIISCSDSNMDDVPLCLNPKLISLSLHKSKIRTLYVTSLRYYTDLRYVNLSQNQITRIDQKSFEYQHYLEELHLAANKISHLDSEMFVGLNNLTVLSLRGNLLEEIYDSVFGSLSKLEHLDLSHNRLSSFSEDALNGLPRLTVLLLGTNLLTSIPAISLSRVPHLAELSMGGNRFNRVEGKHLQALPALTSLDLSSTDLNEGIPDNSFSSLVSLRTLKLNDCQLKNVPTRALSSLTRLEALEISKNLFRDIPKGAFAGNRRLSSLTITGCPQLTRISSGSLSSNLDLLSLDLSRNPLLTYLPASDFRFLSLSRLDLHANQIQYLAHDIANWDDINAWYLHDNPFTCNCSVSWLREMLLKKQNASSSGRRRGSTTSPISCSKPPSLRASTIVSLSLSALECGLSATTRGIVIGSSVCVIILMLGVLAAFFIYRPGATCLRHVLKGHKWGRGRGASTHRSYDSDYPCIKPVPVTEL